MLLIHTVNTVQVTDNKDMQTGRFDIEVSDKSLTNIFHNISDDEITARYERCASATETAKMMSDIIMSMLNLSKQIKMRIADILSTRWSLQKV